MKIIFNRFGQNIINVFSGYSLLFHFLAIVSTYLIVISSFDFAYFQFWNETAVKYFLFSSAAIGGLFPLLVPFFIFVFGKVSKKATLVITSFALVQAEILGSIVSSFYKAITGRAHPSMTNGLVDLTHTFNFGFFKEGIFWGWPSSHTTIAFAMALTLFILYQNKFIRTLVLTYALYIGIGVSMTIHWFSDFTAGAIFGTLIGVVVGKSFKERLRN